MKIIKMKKIYIIIIIICIIILAIFGIGFGLYFLFKTDDTDCGEVCKFIPGKIKVACVGDSITWGSHIKNRNVDSYPAQLQKLLGDAYTVCNFGCKGRTMSRKGDTPYVITKNFKASIKQQPDIVILQLGTNDSKTINWVDQAFFEKETHWMLSQFINLPSKPTVYVSLPPPFFCERKGFNIKAFNYGVLPGIKNVAQQLGITVINVNGSFLDTNGNIDSSYKKIFPDCIHPNHIGAGIIAKTIHNKIK